MANKTRYLVVNCDDFGYCSRRNEGIIRCIRENSVSSVSVLVNGQAAEEVQMLKSFSKDYLSIGLHFNVSEGYALSPISSISSLLNEENYFLGKFYLHQASIDGKIINDEVERELRTQIHRFKVLMGCLPTHIDGHQHVHILPGIREVFAKVLQDENIAWTRMPIDNQLEKCNWIANEKKQFYKSIIEMAKESFDLFKSQNLKNWQPFPERFPANFHLSCEHFKRNCVIRHPHFVHKFIGMSCMGRNLTLHRLKEAILDDSSCDENRICEIMVHPGYAAESGIGGCGCGPDNFALSVDREHEMNILCSQEWKDLLKSLNAKLVSFRELSTIVNNSAY